MQFKVECSSFVLVAAQAIIINAKKDKKTMSDGFIVEAVSRDSKYMGKGASRRLRREKDMIPAVVYGTNKEAKSIMLAHNDLLHKLDNERFYSSILELKIDGSKPEQVIIKALQRHAYKPKVLHADFLRVSAKAELKVTVPIHFLGGEEAPGVKEGGILSHPTTEAEVLCLPKDLPESLEIDISELEMNESLHLSNIKLPADVTLSLLTQEETNDLAIASIHMPQVVEEEPEELAEGETAEGDVPAGDVPAEDQKSEDGDAEAENKDKG